MKRLLLLSAAVVRADRRTGVGLRSESDLRQLRRVAQRRCLHRCLFRQLAAGTGGQRRHDGLEDRRRRVQRRVARRPVGRRRHRRQLDALATSSRTTCRCDRCSFYDTRATAAQREALRAFVTSAAGKNIGVVVREEIVPITFEQTRCTSDPASSHHDGHSSAVPACIKVAAGNLVAARDAQHPPLRSSLREPRALRRAALARRPQRHARLRAADGLHAARVSASTWSIPDTRGGFVADFEIIAPPK